MAGRPPKLGGARGFQIADVLREPIVQKVDRGAHRRQVAHSVVRQQQQVMLALLHRRHAADQVGLAVGDHAGQHANPKAGANAHQQAGRSALVDGDLPLQVMLLEKALIGAPQAAPAAADNRMCAKLGLGARDAMLLGIAARAIKRPVVAADPAADDPGRRRLRRAAKRDVGLARAEIADVAGRVKLDADRRVEVVSFREHWGQQGVREDILGGQPHRPAD